MSFSKEDFRAGFEAATGGKSQINGGSGAKTGARVPDSRSAHVAADLSGAQKASY